MFRVRILALLAVSLPGLLFASDLVTVAVSSNFAKTATEIAARFTEDTGIPVRISAGSTGKLYAQIINGAPFDVFLAADSRRPLMLEKSGHVANGSRRNYAIGRLVVWTRDQRLKDENCREALERGKYDKLALANPETAPYGYAAREFLDNAGLWDVASSRAVFGENIAQTLQFVATGNATLGLIAASQLADPALPSTACSWNVPSSLHTALHQQVVLLERASDHYGARRFVHFLKSPAGVEIIRQHGYQVPD